MKTKLVLSTQKRDLEFWVDLRFIPRKNEWFNINDFFNSVEIAEVRNSAQCWTSNTGVVQSVEYRKENKIFFVEIYIWCED